jgi:hypothetical protein
MHTHVHIHEYTHVHIHARAYVYVHVLSHTHTHTHTHVHMYTHTCSMPHEPPFLGHPPPHYAEMGPLPYEDMPPYPSYHGAGPPPAVLARKRGRWGGCRNSVVLLVIDLMWWC